MVDVKLMTSLGLEVDGVVCEAGAGVRGRC